eukprot:NODE_212_length_14557_cov_0.357103.p2 type:complete len:437 gc:universal NODE_212_length_14557_cov_0.357103:8162-9472(+)
MMFFSISVLAQVTVNCSNPRIRKDFRVVQSEGNWSRIVSAYRKMKSSGRITYYAKLHKDIFSTIHNTYTFFTWHRAFLWEFENEIRAIGGNDLTLPYIDWAGEATKYNGQIDRSQSNDPYYYAKQSGQCLTGQIYDSFLLSSTLNSGTCVSRSTATSVLVGGWADLDGSIINSKDYRSFSDALQYGIHAEVHVRIGGNMAQAISPVDPFFFAHHGFIDSTLSIWQFVHNNFDNMATAESSETFVINGHTYKHADVFNLKNMCTRYWRYTQTSTSKRLKKRQENAVPTATETAFPSVTELETETEIFSVPDYDFDDPATVEQYNAEVAQHYTDLKNSISSKDECYKKIGDFYPGSFIPVNNTISEAALKKIGLDPKKFVEVRVTNDARRDDMSKYGNFTRKTVEEVISENANKYGNALDSGSALMSSALLLLALAIQ